MGLECGRVALVVDAGSEKLTVSEASLLEAELPSDNWEKQK
jgi:hypothetical protein